jgi:outer membrane protein
VCITGVLCLALLPPAPGSEIASELLTLDRAVQLALQNNTEVKNTTLDVAKARSRSAAYRTTFFPRLSWYMLGSEQLNTVSFTIEQGSLGLYPAIGPLPSQDIRYSTPLRPTGFFLGRVSQPLSGIYKTHLTLGSLNLTTSIEEQSLRAKRDDIVRNVKQLYYGIEQTQSSLEAAKETVALYQEVKRVTADYVAKQTALEAQLLQADANLADAQQSEITLSDQEADQKEKLNDLLGRDVAVAFDVSKLQDAVSPPNNLDAARNKALLLRPEIQQAHLKALQSEQEVRAKRAEYIPDVSAEFNSLTLINFNSFLPGGSYSAGFSLSWEPFDWGRKRNELTEKQDTVAQDKNTEASTRRKVLLDVDDKFRQLHAAGSKLRAANLGQRAAAEGLRVYKDQYEVKAALLQVVFQAQSTLAQANATYYRALADYWTAQAEFDHALGEDQ